jgi:hypothetical protein
MATTALQTYTPSRWAGAGRFSCFRPCRGASITKRGKGISSFSGPILVEAHR